MKIPPSEAAKRIATLFGRKRLFTWADNEGKAYAKLVKDECFEDLSDLDLIEQYYKAERAKKDGKGIHRRDLLTFLNHYLGELDRARAWAEKNPQKVVRHVTQKEPDINLWRSFLAEKYPARVFCSYHEAPVSVHEEFKQWEKKQV